MRFFLLGGGEDLLPLLRAIHQRHSVLGWCDCSGIGSQLTEMFPGGAAVEGTNEARIDSSTIVVAGMSKNVETHEARLRELAREGVPMVLVQPPCSAIFAMELDMIRRDTQAAMIPLHPASLHPAMELLASWCKAADPPVGKIEQIVLERTAHDRLDASVQCMLARDALLLRRLMGNFRRVGALQASDERSLRNLNVHLTGSTEAIARWSIGPVVEQAGAAMAITGERGKITVQMPDDGDWTICTSGIRLDIPAFEFDSSSAILEQIDQGMQGIEPPPTWEDAVRCMDLADVASESVRRGKTLSINNERLTEEDTFKGMMAAGGCLILLVLPLILLMVTLVDGLRIPISKKSSVSAVRNRRSTYLPSDVNTLDRVYLSTGEELKEMTAQSLFDAYGANQSGRPAAFSISGGQISLAPVPDEDYELQVQYKGSFSIGRRWALILLVPILLFLSLQLFKLAFPKHAASES